MTKRNLMLTIIGAICVYFFTTGSDCNDSSSSDKTPIPELKKATTESRIQMGGVTRYTTPTNVHNIYYTLIKDTKTEREFLLIGWDSGPCVIELTPGSSVTYSAPADPNNYWYKHLKQDSTETENWNW